MHLYRNSLLWKWKDWSKSSPFAGVPEICYWEALRSQELSFSKSKQEHHKSVPSSWALGSAKRQNADFFKDLVFKKDCGAVTEHAFLLFNLFSKVTALTFAFSDVHWSLPELELWGTGRRLSPGSCVLRPQRPKVRMLQMAFFSLLNNWNNTLTAAGVASPLIWSYWHWISPGRWKDWRLWFVGPSLSRVLQQPQDCPRPASRLGIPTKTTSSDVANESWHLGPMFWAVHF